MSNESHDPPSLDKLSEGLASLIVGEPLRLIQLVRPYDLILQFESARLHVDGAHDPEKPSLKIEVLSADSSHAENWDVKRVADTLIGQRVDRVRLAQTNELKLNFGDRQLRITADTEELDLSVVGMGRRFGDESPSETVDQLKALIVDSVETDHQNELGLTVSDCADAADRLVETTCCELMLFFKSQLAAENVVKVRAALLGLSRLSQIRCDIIPVIVPSRNDARPHVVAEALLALHELDYWFTTEDLDDYWNSGEPFVQQATLRAARNVDDTQHSNFVRQALVHESAALREAACREVDDDQASNALSVARANSRRS